MERRGLPAEGRIEAYIKVIGSTVKIHIAELNSGYCNAVVI